MKRNTPPHIKLALPDGSRLTAVYFAPLSPRKR